MTSVLFVCHGNICRSPMAQFIFDHIAKENGREGDLCAFSAAVSSEEIWGDTGSPVYPPARDVLRRHGIPFGEHNAVQIRKEDKDKYDLIIAMDRSNVRGIERICGKSGKIHLLLEYAGEDRDISDPWYSGDFERAYEDIYKGCLALFKSLVG